MTNINTLSGPLGESFTVKDTNDGLVLIDKDTEGEIAKIISMTDSEITLSHEDLAKVAFHANQPCAQPHTTFSNHEFIEEMSTGDCEQTLIRLLRYAYQNFSCDDALSKEFEDIYELRDTLWSFACDYAADWFIDACLEIFCEWDEELYTCFSLSELLARLVDTSVLTVGMASSLEDDDFCLSEFLSDTEFRVIKVRNDKFFLLRGCTLIPNTSL